MPRKSYMCQESNIDAIGAPYQCAFFIGCNLNCLTILKSYIFLMNADIYAGDIQYFLNSSRSFDLIGTDPFRGVPIFRKSEIDLFSWRKTEM